MEVTRYLDGEKQMVCLEAEDYDHFLRLIIEMKQQCSSLESSLINHYDKNTALVKEDAGEILLPETDCLTIHELTNKEAFDYIIQEISREAHCTKFRPPNCFNPGKYRPISLHHYKVINKHEVLSKMQKSLDTAVSINNRLTKEIKELSKSYEKFKEECVDKLKIRK